MPESKLATDTSQQKIIGEERRREEEKRKLFTLTEAKVKINTCVHAGSQNLSVSFECGIPLRHQASLKTELIIGSHPPTGFTTVNAHPLQHAPCNARRFMFCFQRTILTSDPSNSNTANGSVKQTELSCMSTVEIVARPHSCPQKRQQFPGEGVCVCGGGGYWSTPKSFLGVGSYKKQLSLKTSKKIKNPLIVAKMT